MGPSSTPSSIASAYKDPLGVSWLCSRRGSGMKLDDLMMVKSTTCNGWVRCKVVEVADHKAEFPD